MEQEKIILETANEVRIWAEHYAKNSGFPPNLCGLCAIASAELHKRLKEKNIHTTLCISEKNGYEECHVFLKTNNKILDITASQFAQKTFGRVKEKIILIPKNKAKFWFWKPYIDFESHTDLINHQVDTFWFHSQVALA